LIIQTLKTHVVVANRSRSNMLNHYRYHVGQFQVSFHEIKLTGDDVHSFLQNQSTFDIDLVTTNQFQLISFLDPQGRVECYGWLLNSNSQFSFLVPSLILERTVARLNRFLISEDVELSEPTLKSYNVLIGPEVSSDSAKGVFFDEVAYLQTAASDLPQISNEDIELWRGLTGWPKFDGSDFSYEILNNLRLFDLTLIQNKGCYPGQETVSKIATRRGAAYSPVLIEMNEAVTSFGEITSFEKKIGKATGCYAWDGKYYLAAELLRDFRVEKMKVKFELGGKAFEGMVRYYPLISGDTHAKATELYYQASDDFRDEKLQQSEEKFQLAIKLDPKFADAYESLGVMLGRQDRYPEAIDLMSKLIEVEPKSVLAHTNMSLFLMKVGKIAEAEEHKSLATIKSFQSFGDEAKNKEVEKLRKQKQQDEWAQRESMFKQVLEIDPDDTLANYGVGSIAVEKGEWQIARDHLEHVLKQDPKYSVAYLALGKALKGLGLNEEAKSIWREGIKVSAAKGDLMPANQMQQELNF
jgi:folate-binding Fe-S cluster repair protein YgfZ/Tfp pilus assembly protein PilF